MRSFCITHLVKIRDIVEAEDEDQAVKRFRAIHPAALDKEARLLEITQPSVIRVGGLRVLVIEDKPIIGKSQA